MSSLLNLLKLGRHSFLFVGSVFFNFTTRRRAFLFLDCLSTLSTLEVHLVPRETLCRISTMEHLSTVETFLLVATSTGSSPHLIRSTSTNLIISSHANIAYRLQQIPRHPPGPSLTPTIRPDPKYGFLNMYIVHFLNVSAGFYFIRVLQRRQSAKETAVRFSAGLFVTTSRSSKGVQQRDMIGTGLLFRFLFLLHVACAPVCALRFVDRMRQISHNSSTRQRSYGSSHT